VLANHPDLDFVGFWGRRADSAQRAVDHVGAGKAFSDLDELFSQVDLVSIALPPDVQPNLAIRAAEAGKHLLLEKPLALDPTAARRVADAVRKRHVHSLVFLTYLFQPDVLAWLHKMSTLARKAGPWEGAIVSCAGGIGADDSPYRDSTWRWERGGLWDWGPHALSVLQALLPPITHLTGTRGVRDTANVILTHQTRATSYLMLTVTAPPGAEDSSVVVWGPGGRHRLDLPTGSLREAYGRAIGELQQAIVAGGEPSPECDEATAAVDVLFAADATLAAAPRPAYRRPADSVTEVG
jgi:predicted dehydrogenase